MNQNAPLLQVAILSIVLSGCASLPKATTHYYLTTSKADIKVVRTVGCDSANHVLVANTVTPTMVNTADTSKPKFFNLQDLAGTFSDSDVKFERTDDGRILSINASTTGQGEEVLKAVATFASTAAVFAFDGGAATYPTQCKLLKDANGSKPVTLTYEQQIIATPSGASDHSATERGKNQNVLADTSSGYYADVLRGIIGDVYVVLGDTSLAQAPIDFSPPDSAKNVIHARQPGSIHAKVWASESKSTFNKPALLWEGDLPFAQFGTDYLIPIQAPSTFGSMTTAATFTDGGALKSFEFESKTGASQVVEVANSAMTDAQGVTAAKVADVKAQADLIAQQQRLVLCESSPKDCK